MQHEILGRTPLLDEKGRLTEAGFARTPQVIYDRRAVRALPFRRREWDRYFVMNGEYAVELTAAELGAVGADRISVLALGGMPAEKTVTSVFPLAPGGRDMPQSSADGDVLARRPGWELRFCIDDKGRRLYAEAAKFGAMGRLTADIRLFGEPAESLVRCAPFGKPKQFLLSRQIGGMRAAGRVCIGDREIVFRSEDSFAMLDWERGVWPYKSEGFRGGFSGFDAAGEVCGFHIAGGFGSSAAATENALLCAGRLSKLGEVRVHIPQAHGRADYMRPWVFSSADGRFETDFYPVLDRCGRRGFGPLRAEEHCVFGRYTGRMIADDGRTVELKNALGWAEKTLCRG